MPLNDKAASRTFSFWQVIPNFKGFLLNERGKWE